MGLGRIAASVHTEIIALLGSVQRLEDLNTEGRDITISICSDSQAAQRVLAVLATRSQLTTNRGIQGGSR